MVLVFAICFGVITGALAAKYNRNAAGWGIFGLLCFILALPCLLIAGAKNVKTCGQCGEQVKDIAKVCKHCNSSFGITGYEG